MLALNGGPYYASDEKVTPMRAGVKKANKFDRSMEYLDKNGYRYAVPLVRVPFFDSTSPG